MEIVGVGCRMTELEARHDCPSRDGLKTTCPEGEIRAPRPIRLACQGSAAVTGSSALQYDIREATRNKLLIREILLE
jgi:hypothetical protein